MSRAKTQGGGRARTERPKDRRQEATVPASPAYREPTNPPRAMSVGDDQLVEITEVPEVPVLQIAVHETAQQLVAAQHAIIAAGHVVAKGAAGRDGIASIIAAVADGQIDCVLVGLPGGEPVIAAAHALAPRNPVVIAASSGSALDAVSRAQGADADLATVRPHDAEKLAPVLFAASRLAEHRRELTTARGSEAVLRARLDNLTDTEGALQPFEMFQKVLELELRRARRYQYPLSVALFALEMPPPPHPPGVKGILRARAGNALIQTIRDIDLATEIDHERFLVLLPYTDLTGSALVGRRVIAAAAAVDPVVAAGRSFVPKLVGSVAGAKPDQQLSFARLMRDATRALEAARRDGAELAVSP